MHLQRAALLVAAVALLLAAAPAPRRVVIVRASSISFDDEEVVVMVRVEPAPDNRALIIAAVDEDGVTVRSSLEQLDGADAPRTRWLRWWRLPAGDLIVVAAIFDNNHELARDTRPMKIVSRR